MSAKETAKLDDFFRQLNALTSDSRIPLNSKADFAQAIFNAIPVINSPEYNAYSTDGRVLLRAFAFLAVSFVMEKMGGVGTVESALSGIGEGMVLVGSRFPGTLQMLRIRFGELTDTLNKLKARAEKEAAAAAAEKESKRHRAALNRMIEDLIQKGMARDEAIAKVEDIRVTYFCNKAIYDMQQVTIKKYGHPFTETIRKDGRIQELLFERPELPWAQFMKGGGHKTSRL